MSEEQIFLNALDLPDAAARGTYLDEACGGDTGLRQKVEALLAAHFKSGEFLAVPAPEQISVGSSFNHAVTIQSDSMPANHKPDDDSDALEFLAPSTRPDSLGRLGHYEVLQILGKGGFGIVLRAFDDVLQRVVAVKVMAPQMAATSPARKRFLREAQSSAKVRHENVVQVYEVGEQPLPYLVMEFIPGETLQQMLDRMGPLDVGETVRIGRQIAEGLAAAHATDLIHRDIKPGNVLLEGGQHKVKITDFGLARAADDASMTQSGMIAGTPMYMAPEQVLGQTLDQRADLFSLGSVLYQMVAGRPPFRANTTIAVLKRVAEDTPRAIREVIPETPQWLCDIIAKLHAKKPEDRYQSAREVADVLADCEAQLKQNARLRDFSRIPSPSRPRAATWKWAAAAAAVLLPILVLALTEFSGVTRLFRGQQQAIPIGDARFGPADGFVPLFNGKDLTGWKTHPERPGRWRVERGALVGSTVPSFLFSDGTFSNFHLRLEAKINRGGDSGIFFRAPFSMRPGRLTDQARPAAGYEVELQRNPTYAIKTGSILDAETAGPPKLLWKNELMSLPSAEEWFTLEIIADGNRIISKVNGTQTADCRDPRSRYDTGHLALQIYNPETVVQFRKIEIKELPASPPAADGFVQLFNGKDLTGWKTQPEAPGHWEVKDGVLIGSQIQEGDLYSERADFANFHLRVQAKVNLGGDSGVFFRAGSDAQLGEGYEAEIHHNRTFTRKTGTIEAIQPNGPPLILGLVDDDSLTRPDEWFEMEIIAQQGHFITKINGRETANCSDPANRHAAGHIGLQVWNRNTVVQFRKIEIKELPASPPAAEGFVQLFNGQDLTGWKTHPEAPQGHWEVKEGVLIGSQAQGFLYSERADFANFHLRVQAKVNLGGDSGVLFRLGSEVPPGGGYEAEIQKNRAYARKTGTIGAFQPNGPPLILGLVDDDSLTRPDEWFDLEIIAQQGHFITKINGLETANCSVPTNPNAAGHIVLQVWNANTVVQFRKIEIKELPASPPATDGFVSLFNGKDLTGWKKHALSGGDWKVEDGAIDGRGITSYLFTESSDYANFHLRVEAKINGNGDAGVYVRTPFDVGPLPITGPAKFTLLGGYEAALALRANYPTHTGSLTAADGSILLAGPLLPHKPDEWFVLEVIAEDNRIRTLVDGQPAADYLDEQRRFSRGHIALQTWGPGITSVQFRRVEIKELPASPPAYTNSIGMEFVIVPKGKSWLGGGKNKLGDKEVEIPADFYLGKFEVTQEEWEKVMEENPSHFSRTGGGMDAVKDIADADLKRFPVEMVSWEQCQRFVEKLNQREKEAGWVYRLPTMSEWEYACRGGPMVDKLDGGFSHYFKKPTNTLLPQQANFSPDNDGKGGLGRTCKVGSYESNRLWLNDMQGNVWELCEDAVMIAGGVSLRMSRGGSWFNDSRICKATGWLTSPPSVRYNRLGLRLARVPSGDAAPAASGPASVNVQALRDFVLAKEGERDLAKQSHAEGKLSQLDLLYAEIDVSEGRIQLALAEKNAAGSLAALRSLVAFREQERALIAEQVKTGVSKADDLERADSSLSDAQSRLAKAIAEAPQP